ncbi:hypothetical protein Pfo_011424 [Paulownia fortunei]|nr:hypothetical protein Pfo_011424 [Paulownia fortunei]
MEREQGMPAKKVWESVKSYTVRCAKCSKWRLIPTKEKYEEIRARIGEQLFFYEADVKQDDSYCWALDKPRIPQTPPGWQRILRIRAEGGTKFADVYYVAPSNKRFRSMVELSRYISEHPEYVQEGVSISQFSFQPPIPLDEKYIAKRASRALKTQNDSSGGPEAPTTDVEAPTLS